jgi:hypothetical protein
MNFVDPRGRYFGRKRLVLNNLVEDPTLVREILAYRLHRALGVPAPEAGYARVYLDGRYVGLYLFLEAIDDEFLEARFDDPDGELFEGEYGCDLYPEDVPALAQEEGAPDRAPLARLVAAAAGPAAGLIAGPDARFDRSALAYLAVSAVIGDFDGYRHAHNYRLYREPAQDRWYFLPWGLDRTFTRHLDVFDSYGVVARRCFADRACRIAYLRELGRVADQLERFGFDRGIEVLDHIVRDAAAEDRAHLDPKRTRRARAELIDFVRTRPAEVRAALACLEGDREVDRDGDGYGCLDCDDADPTIHPGAPEACDGRDDDCSGRADDAAACPCPEVTIEGAAFELCAQPTPWVEAAAMCAAKGGALARLDSPAQASALYAAARRQVDGPWWIGLSDRATEGTFAWADGAPLAATAWARGEPDLEGCNQDCVAFQDGADGRWHDTHCGQPAPFICRLPGSGGQR